MKAVSAKALACSAVAAIGSAVLAVALVSPAIAVAQPAGTGAASARSGEPGEREGRIRVQITPRNEVVLSSELAAAIASLPLREGEFFRAGSTLVSFDCSPFQAQLAKGEALLDSARQTLAVNQRLAALDAVGTLDVQQSEAKVKEYTAEVEFTRFTVSRCSLRAPFSGRIGKRMAAQFQYVTPGTPLMSILDTASMEVQMIAPSRWLSWIKPGQRFSVDVDELGRTLGARVLRVGARIDPVSQSVTLVGVVDANQPGLLSGMSGWANFPVPR